MTTEATPTAVGSNDELGPLPEPDVQWVDGKDQWGYDDYSQAYSAEATTAYAAQQVAAERERCAHLAGELQALRNHVAHWHRAGIDDAALTRADNALRELA